MLPHSITILYDLPTHAPSQAHSGISHCLIVRRLLRPSALAKVEAVRAHDAGRKRIEVAAEGVALCARLAQRGDVQRVLLV